MNTPIYDFVTEYMAQNKTRMHMPGHKGHVFLGGEPRDITEIYGADVLHHAKGIIQESQENARAIFGTGKTFYSTEGSSLCIKAMLDALAWQGKGRTLVAARNVHRSMIDACGLLDLTVEFVQGEETQSICTSILSPESLAAHLAGMEQSPLGVYVTSPDYLGNCQDIAGLAKVCKQFGVPLVVDNAHGAYLHFLEPSGHPMDLGAAMCCDSAHKTFPVLTGGAYLHVAAEWVERFARRIPQGMALFGSTSPSYLILQSLDLCNAYLADGYAHKLEVFLQRVRQCRMVFVEAGYVLEEGADPLKLTIDTKGFTIDGEILEQQLREADIECEYADRQYVVCMLTPENTEQDLERLERFAKEHPASRVTESADHAQAEWRLPSATRRRCSIREGIFAPSEEVCVEEAVGRICAAETVACPPAVPIAICGEEITEEMIKCFKMYGIEKVSVLVKETSICYTAKWGTGN